MDAVLQGYNLDIKTRITDKKDEKDNRRLASLRLWHCMRFCSFGFRGIFAHAHRLFETHKTDSE